MGARSDLDVLEKELAKSIPSGQIHLGHEARAEGMAVLLLRTSECERAGGRAVS